MTKATQQTVITTALVGVCAGVIGGLIVQSAFFGASPAVDRSAPATAEEAVVRVAREASPGVVSIIIERPISSLRSHTGPLLFEEFGFPFPFEEPDILPVPETGDDDELVRVGGGSGFIVSSDGLILTNRHVLNDDQARFKVALDDGTQYDAAVVAIDPFLDIGLLRIETQGLPALALGDSDALEIGQTVIAIGNALSQFSNTVTRGVVSGIGRQVVAGNNFGASEYLEEAIQTDAAINPGNSGGPLLNLQGEVVGVNTATSLQGESVSFAIPINAVKRVIESVKEHGRIVRAWLGVRYSVITPQLQKLNDLAYDYGALIIAQNSGSGSAVFPGSPAALAGLSEQDIILELNGDKITREHSLARMVSGLSPGDRIVLKVYFHAQQQEREVEVVLGEFPLELE